ncbi:uncharacterized protein LOC110456936 isoform X2 [Mizuhopecten yessoensis]|uniref:uncharacterized protein LOC110456936 isoform X2 n=1 Tax=Mizuhopecten yessoensis TaxID=6573 RepID=UPI000B45A2B6|nr:uncharacterized protein LOC110456936 isoform X2 [Mizuhopecten yessoensis]
MSTGNIPVLSITLSLLFLKKEVASMNISTSLPEPNDVFSTTTSKGCYQHGEEDTDTSQKPVLFYLFLLLLLVPVAIATYICTRKRKKHRKRDRDSELTTSQRFLRKHFHQDTRKGRRIQIEVSPPSDDDNDHRRRSYGRRRAHTNPSVMKNAKNCHRCSEVSSGSVFLNDSSRGTPSNMCPQSQRRSSRPSSINGGHLLMVPACGPGGSSRCASYLTLHGAQEPDPQDIDMPRTQRRRQARSSCSERECHHRGPAPTARISQLYLQSQRPSYHQSLPHPQLMEDRHSQSPMYNDYGRYVTSPTIQRGRPEKIAKSLPFLYDFALDGKSYPQHDPSNRKESWQSARGFGHSQSYGNEITNKSWFPSESDIAEFCTAHEDTLMNCTDNTVFEHGPDTSEGIPSSHGIFSSSQTPVNPTGRHVGTPQTVKVQNFSVSHVYTAEDTGSKKAMLFNKKKSHLSIECESESVVNTAPQDCTSCDSYNNSLQRQTDFTNETQSLLVDKGGQQPRLVADYDNTTFETSMVEVAPRLSLPFQENIGDFQITENKSVAAMVDPNNNLDGKTRVLLKSTCSDVLVLEEGESMV